MASIKMSVEMESIIALLVGQETVSGYQFPFFSFIQ